MFKKFFEGISKKHFFFIVILTFLWSLFQSCFTSILSKTLVLIFEKNLLFSFIIFYICFVILWEVVEFLSHIFLEKINVNISSNIYYKYFNKLYKIDLQKIENINNSYISSAVLKMIEQKKNFCFKLSEGINSLVYIGYTICYLYKYSIFLSIAVLSIAVFSCTILAVGGILTSKKLQFFSEMQIKQSNLFMDGANKLITLKNMYAKHFFSNKIKNLNKDTLEACIKFNLPFQLFFCIYRFSSYLIFPICIFISFRLSLFSNAKYIAELITYISMITVILVNKFGILSNTIESMLIWKAAQIKVDMIFNKSFENKRDIFKEKINEFNITDLTYNYKFLTIKIPKFIFNNGDFVCITGESGQGKTTLLKLVSGILESNEKIFVNGIPLKGQIDVAYMSQANEIFDLTLKENLVFGNSNISDKELLELIEEVGLKEWFDKQAYGLNTRCGDQGIFISEGQKQRLNIIRTLLMDKIIYLFDEPTSHIDLCNKRKVILTIKKRLKGKTVIFTTHDNYLEKICNKKYHFEKNILSQVII